MKRRVMSLVLALVMILSMLPATVLAANDDQNTASVLKMHVEMEENGKQFEKELTEWSQNAYDMWKVRFYLHDSDGNATMLEADDLTLPGFLVLEDLEDDGWYILEAVGAGTGDISYNGYTLPITSKLPDLGLYSGMPFDEKTLMRDVLLSDDSRVFYIALGPELLNNGFKMTKANETFGPEVTGIALQEIGSVVLSADGSYATVTVTDLTAEGHHHFEATIADRDGDFSGIWGRSVHINNDMPKLHFCNLDRSEDAVWTVNTEYVQTDWWCPPGNNRIGCFFFGSRSEIQKGNVETLTLDDLTFPAYMDVNVFENSDEVVPENAFEVKTTRFHEEGENTDIVYTAADGTAYTISAIPVLPEIAFYRQPVARKEAYIHGDNPFVVTETNRTFYICPEDADRIKLTSVVWQENVPADLFTVMPSVDAANAADGRYLEVTVKDDVIVANRHYDAEIKYQYQHHDEWVSDTYWISVCLKNGQPALMWRHMDWDNEEQEWVESDREPENQMVLRTGDELPLQFYYGIDQEMEKVEWTELTFPTDILRAYMREGALWIEAVGFEKNGVITYKDSDTDVSAQIQLQILQPDFALYSSTDAKESTYLGEEVTLSSEADVFYVVSDSECAILDMIAIRSNRSGEDVTDHFDVQLSDDGAYAAIRMKKDADGNLPAGGDYEIEIMCEWGEWYLHFKLIRGDIQQLSTPTELSWHKMYHWDVGSADDYEARNGVMSFNVGELTQNRYQIEIYSAENNYAEPVNTGNWSFGDMNDTQYRSVTDFIYSDLGSGTYKFRVRAEGDGTKYRDSNWSAWSEEWTYTAPEAQLIAPDANEFAWVKGDDGYISTWRMENQTGAGYYEVNWYYQDAETGRLEQHGGSFDIALEDMVDSERVEAWIHDEMVQEHGNVPYFFRVRVIPLDITVYRSSPWSDFSEALDTSKITDDVNDKLDNLIPDTSSGQQTTVQDVQDALTDETAALRLAMTADLSVSGGASSGTLDRVKELEDKVVDNVDQKVEAKNSAPKAIKAIADDIEMVGAILNLADKNPESGKTPTVTLEIDEPQKGIVIPEQQHNAVQFSMKLNGAIDKDDQEQAGQQLIVPVVIDMPVPEGINPDFLVVLHRLWNGEIEQMRPHIYWAEAENRYRATFVIDSFSDFALLEYNFAFELDSVNKTVGDPSFVFAATGSATGSEVTYSSSDTSVATVDPVTGEVTILKAGTVTITASASAIGFYPEAQASYTLTVTSRPASFDDAPAVNHSQNKTNNPFTDVAADSYYYDAVLWAVENDITTGTTAATFSPDEICTRAQVVTLLWRAAGSPEPKSTVMPFDDVAADSYYYDAVLWAAENGITTGTTVTTFSPDNECTRGQIVTFLWRAQGSEKASANNPFADVASDAYCADAVIWAVDEAITNGTGDGTFSPDADCTRAQIVTFLWRCSGK